MNASHYDAVVIGSGQGGNPLATALAKAGMRTALIERKHVGGTCINEGCTPTKTMVASGRVAYLARRAADYGVQTGPISIDLAKVRQRKRDIVAKFRSGNEQRLAKTQNLELVRGEASFSGPKTLAVRLSNAGQRELSADRIFINAGTRASRPRLEGLETVAFLDNESVMELDKVPDHLLGFGLLRPPSFAVVLLFHHQLRGPGAERLHFLAIHAGLFHDGDDLLAHVMEDGFDVLALPFRAAEVDAKALVGLQEAILPLLQALDLIADLLGQLAGNHGRDLQGVHTL